MNVTVIGTGYVGLIQGVCLAKCGHDVTCLDLDSAKIAKLRSGVSPIYEPGVDEMLDEGIASGKLRFETVTDGFGGLLGDVVFVAVGTPSSLNGAADLSAVRTVVESIAEAAEHPLVLVMKSTVPPGTGHRIQKRSLADAKVAVSYVSNPEFLREGHAIADWFSTDRVVLGGDDPAALDVIEELYSQVDAPVIRTDVASAETIKYASNAFLATKISFINEIANVCDCVGADIDSVSAGVGLDKRIGADFLRAGIGYGGSCFPKDVRALDFISAMSGYNFELLKAVIEVNARQRMLPVIALSKALGGLTDAKIALLGLTFKPDTDDTRDSPAVDIVPMLVEEGAHVRVFDPMAPADVTAGATRCEDVYEALTGAQAVVVATEWPAIVGLDWTRAAGLMAEPRIVFDGRNALDAAAVRAAGLSYMGIGREGLHRAGL